jgi:hypothetical protein
MSESGTKALRQMSDMGHKIGLQIDTRFFRLDKPILSQIEEECKILENITRQEVVSISQRTPIITPDLTSEFTSRYIEASDLKILEYLKYISDSGRNWRQECMCHHIGVDDKMQILVHSEWWGEKNVPPEQIRLSIKDAVKTEIDRLSTVAVANLQLHKDKMFRGWSSGGSKQQARKKNSNSSKKIIEYIGNCKVHGELKGKQPVMTEIAPLRL